MLRIRQRREPTGLAPTASMVPATSRLGERPTVMRVVRRRQQLGAWLATAIRNRDPLHLHEGRFRPPRLARSA